MTTPTTTKDTGKVLIHGREYTTVNSRVVKFHEEPPKDDCWSIMTEIIFRDSEIVVMKATISTPDGRVVATGHAEEKRTSSTINKTSALENAETSAIGRALAALGKGGTEFASADEVTQALNQQRNNAEQQSGVLADHVTIATQTWKGRVAKHEENGERIKLVLDDGKVMYTKDHKLVSDIMKCANQGEQLNFQVREFARKKDHWEVINFDVDWL